MASKPLTLTGPSGREYVWEKDTPPTDRDIAILMAADKAYSAQQESESAVEKEKVLKQAELAGGAGPLPASGMMPLMTRQTRQTMAEVAKTAAPALVESGMATAGQAGGAALAGPPGASVGGAVGGFVGSITAQMMRGEQPSMAEATGAAASSAVPGAPLARASKILLAREAGKQAAANVSGLTLQRLMEGKDLTPEEVGAYAGMAGLSTMLGKVVDPGALANRETMREINDAYAQQYIREAQKEGMKILPSSMNKTRINAMLEALGGKAMTIAELRELNEDFFTALAASQVGVKPQFGKRLSKQLEQAAEEAAAPYGEIRALREKAAADLDALQKGSRLKATNEHEFQVLSSDPAFVKKEAELSRKAAADVDKFRKANANARDYREAYEVSRHPKDLELANEWAEVAEKSRENLRVGLEEMGKKDLYDAFEAARKKIAMIKTIENALTPQEKVSQEALARAIKRGEPLTDKLKTLAMFSSDPRLKSVATSEVTAMPESQGLLQEVGNVVREPFRRIVTSDIYQQTMARPMYSDMPDFLARFVRTGTQADLEERQSQPNSLLQFYAQVYPRNVPPEQQQQQRPVPLR